MNLLGGMSFFPHYESKYSALFTLNAAKTDHVGTRDTQAPASTQPRAGGCFARFHATACHAAACAVRLPVFGLASSGVLACACALATRALACARSPFRCKRPWAGSDDGRRRVDADSEAALSRGRPR